MQTTVSRQNLGATEKLERYGKLIVVNYSKLFEEWLKMPGK